MDALKLKIVPNFYEGHTYLWTVDPGFAEPLPWKFTVEVADTAANAPWTAVSPPLVNAFAYVAVRKPKYNKDYAEQYRVRLQAGEKTAYSVPRTIYADLPRDDFLIIREIQRKEVLQMVKMAGVPCSLWQRMQTGIRCPRCTSELTGEILDANCTWCMGAGFIGGYHGPYPCWATFSQVMERGKTYGPTDIGVMTDVRVHKVRLIGNPYIFSRDVLADNTSGRRYYLDKITSELEIRRIPVVKLLEAAEFGPQDVVHKLGTDTPLGEGVCETSLP